ncbi:pilus assembly protein PilZ [Pueribacillus theae]|uniref:Pilus assembly protein PilZ n=1 Tax=Pueribacillus theae TaxID=2171751 RepID=A0A2U1K4R7_9BACI|nr:flagellar brake domain-containing protein [Pueribacillus theae]PWA12392.1 pilus assembly protein PilZ [Pueribacillus theae]
MLEIGDVIELEPNFNEDSKKFRSKVVDVGEHSIFISLPTNDSTNTDGVFLIGLTCNAKFVSKNKTAYKFQTKIIGRKKEKILMFELSLPPKDEFIRIQRRSYVRVEAQIKVEVSAMNEEFPTFESITLDISGGGLSVLLPEKHDLSNDVKIQCAFTLPFQCGDRMHFQQTCSVVRISEDNNRKKGSFKFEDIEEKDRQAIIRYCFERQLALRKKGLLS